MESNSLTNNQTSFEKISQFVSKYIYKDIVLAIYSIVVFLSWFFQLEIIALIFMMIYVSVVLVFVDDSIPLIPAIILTTFMVADGDNIAKYINFAYAAVAIVVALVFHMIKYKRKIKFGKMFVPQALISFALIIGGVGTISGAHYLGNLALTLLLGIGILLLYFLFYLYKSKETAIDLPKYISKIITWMGIILSAEVFTSISRLNWDTAYLIDHFLDLGWGIDNNAATLLLISAPLTMYLATRKDTKRPSIYILLGALQYLAIIFTYSRGGLLMGVISGIVVLVLLFTKHLNREIIYTFLSIVSIAFLILAIKADAVYNKMNDIFSIGFSDNARLLLYEEALKCFSSHPIFGVGIGYQGYNYDMSSIAFYFFHSTFFQIIACMGIIGIITFAYFYFRRYQIVIKELKNSTFAIFTLIAMLAFEGYSIIDTGTFIPFPCMILMMFLTMVLEDKQTTTKPLNDPILDKYLAKIKDKKVRSMH